MATTRTLLRAAAERLDSPWRGAGAGQRPAVPGHPAEDVCHLLLGRARPGDGPSDLSPMPATTYPTITRRRRRRTARHGHALGLMPGMNYEEKETAWPGRHVSALQRRPGRSPRPAARDVRFSALQAMVGEATDRADLLTLPAGRTGRLHRTGLGAGRRCDAGPGRSVQDRPANGKAAEAA